jgi:YfiH family protein
MTASDPVAPVGRLQPWQPGLWRLPWASPSEGPPALAGVTDRGAELSALRRALAGAALAQAQQVHGVSVAALWTAPSEERPVPGCDALMTDLPRVALVIRSADCVPIAVWDPVRRVSAMMHAGWRGLLRELPGRVIRAMGVAYRSRPADLLAGIGPAIRACCYEVGPEFEPRFPDAIRRARGRRTCDLPRVARRQLHDAGLLDSRVTDAGVCTACDAQRWHSHRRDATADRLYSFILADGPAGPEGHAP